jgi:hypothetical protein
MNPWILLALLQFPVPAAEMWLKVDALKTSASESVQKYPDLIL